MTKQLGRGEFSTNSKNVDHPCRQLQQRQQRRRRRRRRRRRHQRQQISDEFQSRVIRRLTRKCFFLDSKSRPSIWMQTPSPEGQKHELMIIKSNFFALPTPHLDFYHCPDLFQVWGDLPQAGLDKRLLRPQFLSFFIKSEKN